MTKDTDNNLPTVFDDDRPRVFEPRGMHVMLASDVAEVFGAYEMEREFAKLIDGITAKVPQA